LIRKDYIPRYFDELAKVLAAVLHLKNDLKPAEAKNQLNDFSTDYLGVDLTAILTIPSLLLIPTLVEKHHFTIIHFKLLEDVLYHNYLLNPTNKQHKNSTLELLNYLANTDNNYSIERKNRIEELTK